MADNSSAITIRVPDSGHVLPDNAQWTNRFEIRSSSSNRVYIIAQHKSGRYWGCSCPGWKGHKKCRHLEELKLPCYMAPYEVQLKGGN